MDQKRVLRCAAGLAGRGQTASTRDAPDPMAPSAYMNLFTYESVDVSDNLVHFEGITLLKRFPDIEFTPGGRYVCACVNPMYGTVFLYNDMDDISKSVHMKEWIDFQGLCRTDTSSFRFVTTGKITA